jgi:hypothetical protein
VRDAVRLAFPAPNPANDLGHNLKRKILGKIRSRQADDNQDATRRHQTPQPDETRTGVQMVQRRHRTDQIEAGWLQIAGSNISEDIPDVPDLGMIPAALDRRPISVQADDLRYTSVTQLPREFTVTTTHVERSLAAGRDDVEYQGLIPGSHRSPSLTDPPSTRLPRTVAAQLRTGTTAATIDPQHRSRRTRKVSPDSTRSSEM